MSKPEEPDQLSLIAPADGRARADEAADERYCQREQQIFAGRCLPTVRELFRGTSFCGLDMMKDMSRVAGLIHRRYNWLAPADPAFARALRRAKVMAGHPTLKQLPALEAALRRCLDRFAEISWPAGPPHPRLLAALRNLHLRVRFCLACARDRQAQLEISAATIESINVRKSPQENKSLLMMAIGWLVCESSLAGFMCGDDDPLHPGLVAVHGESVASRLSKYVGAAGMAGLFRLRLEGLPTDGEPSQQQTGLRRARMAGQKEAAPAGPGLVVFEAVAKATDERGREAERLVKDVVGKPMPLAACPDVQAVRRDMLRSFPHAASIIDVLLRDAVAARDEQGRSYVKFRPTMLVGPPGAAKSTFAMQLASKLGLKPMLFGCGGVHDGMFGTTSRKWGTGAPSQPVSHVLHTGIGNPAIVLDELEKAGTGRANGNLVDVLLGMLESSTASAYSDQYLMAPVNLSGINWLSTCNDIAGLPGPLRDRFRVLRFPSPGAEHLQAIGNSLLAGIMRERGYDERWVAPLTPDELDALAEIWPTKDGAASIRALKRLIEAVAEARDQTVSSVPH